MRKIRVLIKRPGEMPYTAWMSDTLENLQRTVGGYIETVTLRRGLVVICDEEGRLKGYPHNCTIDGIEFVGVIIIAGVDGDEITSLLFGNYELRRLCPGLWSELENVNRCVCCGEIIPEGRQVCLNCERSPEDDPLIIKAVDDLRKEKK